MGYAIKNAYDVSDFLKSKGGTYNPDTKEWMISDATYDLCVELSKSASAGVRFRKGWARVIARKLPAQKEA